MRQHNDGVSGFPERARLRQAAPLETKSPPRGAAACSRASAAALILALAACASQPAPVVIVQQSPPVAQPPITVVAREATPVRDMSVREPTQTAGDRLTRERLEPWLTNILELHFVGIEGRPRKESFTRASVKDCTAHFETSTSEGDTGDGSGSRTEVASDLKDVVEVTAATPVRIRIAGSGSSTHLTAVGGVAAATDNPGSVTIVLDNGDVSREISSALREMVGLCGGLRQDMFK